MQASELLGPLLLGLSTSTGCHQPPARVGVHRPLPLSTTGLLRSHFCQPARDWPETGPGQCTWLFVEAVHGALSVALFHFKQDQKVSSQGQNRQAVWLYTKHSISVKWGHLPERGQWDSHPLPARLPRVPGSRAPAAFLGSPGSPPQGDSCPSQGDHVQCTGRTHWARCSLRHFRDVNSGKPCNSPGPCRWILLLSPLY